MAYPTSINFKMTEPQMALPGIHETSTVKADIALGTIVEAFDDVYGSGEFVYLKGVAATAKGDLVIYDSKAGTTTRAVAASRGPMAIAMSANVANQYGWYQVFGAGVASTAAAGTGAANALLATSATGGQATVSGAANQKITGIICTTAQDAPGAGFTGVQLTYPGAYALT